MKKITKAVIPAAGFGTRFLPWTKAMPKEMLPIVDKPVIQYVVEEVVESGIKDVIIVTGANKRAIEDHFDSPNQNLVNNLVSAGKDALLNDIDAISNLANFIYVRQKGPYGNGTPVLCAEPAINNEPFAVIWGDEFIHAQPARLAQMMAVYEKKGGVVLSGFRIENKEDLKKYGIADIEPVENNIYKVKAIIEKPDPDSAPSDLGIIGAYILPPEIFEALRNVNPGKSNEIWLVDAINILKNSGVPVYAVAIQNGKYFDTGSKIEYMKTVTNFALQHNDIGKSYKEYLKTLDLS